MNNIFNKSSHINSTHYNIYRLKWLIKDTIEEREDIQKEQKEKKRTNNIKNKERKRTKSKNKQKNKQNTNKNMSDLKEDEGSVSIL